MTSPIERTLVEDVERYRDSAGFLSIWAPPAPLLCSRTEGTLGAAFNVPLIAACERAVAFGEVEFFNDWELLDRYDSRARLELTRWALHNRRRITRSHILVRSKLVAMGVEVANLALGGIYRMYTQRERFEDALRESAHARRLHVPLASRMRR